MIKLKNIISELEFASLKDFNAYEKEHDLRPSTKVTIAGVQTTAGQAGKQIDGEKNKSKSNIFGNNQKPEDFETFAKKRLEGATKIATDAKAKGGVAILTYHHFVVKLPVYK